MKLKQKLTSLVTSLVILGAGIGVSSALDTDIYFLDPSANTTLVRPNLTLILDTSGSMNENVGGTTQSRLDVMKQAMLTVLDEMNDVNVGLARFTHNAGGPVVYPVKNLETVVPDTGNIQVVIQDSQDDAEQTVSSGSVNNNANTLFLQTNATSERQVGLRFRNTYIPQGVTITSAKLVFKARNNDSGAMALRIRADKTPDAPIYTATPNNISGRAQTTAFVDWAPGDWTSNLFYETPNLTSVVQEVVSQTDWCRGNAMAFTIKRNGANTAQRRVYAYDTYQGDLPLNTNPNAYAAPQAALVVTYNPATVPTTSSCHQVVKRVKQGSDDAEQRSGGTNDMTLTGTLQLIRASQDQIVGVRFQGMNIPKNATINSATLEFEVNSTNTAATNLTIRGEASGNPTTFLSSSGNISDRPTTTAAVTWNGAPNLAANQKLVSPDIKTIVKQLVDRGDWVSGNAMAFIISGSGTKNVESYDTEPAAAPLLRVKYTANTATQKTAREQLKELIVAMRAEANTPIVDSLYEAALYYRGAAVDYGRTRVPTSPTDVRARWTRVSHPESYTGGTLSTPVGCTYADPDSANCIPEAITGGPVYRSPIEYECQSNHLILLTDGDANSNSSAAKIRTLAGIGSCSGSGAEACGVSLTTFLSTRDQSASLSDLQTVRTHTIGINISNTFLSDLASNGNGFYRTANDANELITAFNSILNEVLSNPTSFVSPSLSVNAFNRLYNRDEVYFTLFSPRLTVAWPGNVKKYTLCASSNCTFGEVMDNSSPPLPAIDPVTSKIKNTATSFWSSPGDGPQVQVGGAGAQITSYSGRRAYTYTGASNAPVTPVDLSAPAHVVTNGNTAITKTMLGNAAMPDTERTDIINWMRGRDLEDEDSDGDTAEMRWSFADALHSRPATIGYGGTVTNPVIKIVVGTNDGGVRMVDAATGQEDWIVYLPEFLFKQKDYKDNSNGVHLASADGSPTIRLVDNNNDGIIDPNAGDKVQMFIGMRRGVDSGNRGYVYAFDLTPGTGPLTTSSAIGTVKPKFMWRISNALTGYGALGQTWSRPSLTQVYVKCPNGDSSCDGGGGLKYSKVRSVLMFGGGYDPAFDTKLGGPGEGRGNAVYMVDPDTGSRLWWAGGPSSGADLVLTNMKYSIPSDLALLDSDRDGITDRIYVGDLHGQLWRIDLSNQIDPDAASANNRNGGSDATVGYVFADVGCTGGARSTDCTATSNQNQVAFFYPPDVAQLQDDVYASSGNTIYDYVTIGTGDREDPLDKKTQAVTQDPVYNRIYAFRDSNTKLGPPKVRNTVTIPAALTETDLHNADANTLSDPSGSGYAAALADIQGKKGWFINLKETTTPNWIGEKVLARTTIFAGVLYVTTYVPPQSDGTPTVCGAPAEGTAKLYSLNLLNASGVYNNSGDRSGVIGGGIPSELVIVIREGGTSGLIGTSGGARLTQPPQNLPLHRTYWYQE